MSFLPELILTAGALALFIFTLGDGAASRARWTAFGIAVAALIGSVLTIGHQASLFEGAYQINAFSQWLKLTFAFGFLLIVLLNGELPDIQTEVQPEYYLFLTISVLGLNTLVSSIELITPSSASN